ncbi:unnamed protein product [Arctia plantaginis]|uniref:Cytochrome c oxidase subunit Vb n=1 Tax=Arctia plantaginis TaxID=874455 RepID=A0A8S0ZZ31_ARCPL|nr:unnamed protein product [Arctia plantaginis]CAB3238401.1 unnamed protein product [Arctia plantaginis]
MSWLRYASFRRVFSRLYAMFDPIDLVTGLEKRELTAHLAGNCDPFYIRPIKKGPGTFRRPNLIPSVNPCRLVACSCSPFDHHVEFMWLFNDRPKRCGCGHWFELCPVTAITPPHHVK